MKPSKRSSAEVSKKKSLPMRKVVSRKLNPRGHGNPSAKQETEIELRRLNRTLNALRHSSEAIAKAESEEELIDEVCRIIVKDCGHAMVWIGYKENDEHKSVRPVAYSGFEEGYLEALRITWANTERGRGPTGTAVRTGKISFCKNMLTDPKFRPWREEAIKRGYASSLVIPLLDDKKVLGALTIYFGVPDPFTKDEIQLLTELADDLSYGIKAIRLREAHEKAMNALCESEAKANALIKYAPTAIYELDYEHRKFMSVNDAMCRMLGYTKEELLSIDPSALLDEESQARFASRLKKQLAGEKVNESVEYRARKKDGSFMYGLLNVSIELSGTEPHKALVVAYDVTDRKLREEEILRLSTFPKLNPNPITEIGLNGTIRFVNPAAESLFPDIRQLGLSHPWLAHWESIVGELDPISGQRLTREVSVAGRHYLQAIHYVKETSCFRIYGIDISERVNAGEALQSTLHRLQTLISSMHGGVLFVGEEKVELANQTFCNYFGLEESPEDLIGLAPSTMIEKISSSYLYPDKETNRIQEIVIDGKPVIGEEIKMGDGRVCSRDFVPIYKDEKLTGRLWYHIDISERKLAEDALRLSEQKFSAAFTNNPAAVALTRLDDGVFLEVNDTWVAIEGYSRDEVIGVSARKLPIWPSAEAARKFVEGLREKGTLNGWEQEFLKKSGEVFVAELSAQLLTMRNEEVILTTFVDVTMRKKVEADLARYKEHLEELVAEKTKETKEANAYNRNLIEVSLDPIVTIDPEGKIKDVNEATEKITGRTREELIDTDFSDYFTEPAKARAGYEEAFREGRVMDYPLEIMRNDGGATPVLYNASVYRDERGIAMGVFAAARDVSKIKKAEKQQRILLEELTRSNIELEQFANVATHDLQEPLRMISSYVQLLAHRYKDKLDNDANEFIKFAVDGVIRMQALIDSLLHYSRVGRKSKSFEDVDARCVVEVAAANLRTMIDENEAAISIDDLPIIRGDETQLVQLFQNLISNAIKFRRNERPRVHISAKEESSRWVFSVEDNGIGMDSQYHDRIFVIFQRLNPREDYPGTGIGLAICKKIVERHGGKIWMESAVDRGSTFFFTIPK